MSVNGAASPLVLGIAGFGTVGASLIRVLTENKAGITARCGRDIQIKYVLVRDAKRGRATPLPAGASLTTNMDDLVANPEVDVIVELMGGIDTPRTLITRALEAGKHVVTANKALLAETGNEIFALAEARGLHLAYEASVCGGIPVVQTLREGLTANKIQSLVGILNGTSNYILSEMSTKGIAFDEALKKAQELGYAEADPTLDIEGFDAAHKLAILIRLAWGANYPFDKIRVSGISNVEAADILYARQFGYRIKLLGHARMLNGSLANGGIEASVSPTLVHETFLLARVGGSYNAVRIEGDAVGSVFLHGKGAGGMPTGSAVAADILTIARNAAPNNTGFTRPSLPGPVRVVPPEESYSPYYMRLQVTDKPGVLRDIAAIMADNGISIAQVIQKEEGLPQPPGQVAESGPIHTDSKAPTVPFIMMTHEAQTEGICRAMQALAASPMIHRPPVLYRVLPPHR